VTARQLPMFPLSAVLFPHAGTTLHIFEPRYRELARRCTSGDGKFGVVLIERGHEVGGGDVRFGVGTVAGIAEAAELPDGRWYLGVVGLTRLRVREWRPDAPFPLADVDELPPETLPARAQPQLARAEQAVRRALAYKAELNEPAVPATVAFDADPSVAALQLAAAAPLGPLDKQCLLEEDDPVARLDRLTSLVVDLNADLEQRLATGQ
jgi:Lon protease-like protein